jgi:replication factor C small subunit
MKQHSLWIESYRSKTLDEYIGNDAVKNRIASCITKNDIPHLLFAGSAGVGKTTLAKLIVNNIKCDYIYLNASDENGIDTIRDKVKGFASSATFNPIKVIILDEADALTHAAQDALRNIIEEYSLTTRFVLTCNYIEKISKPLQSRCEVHKITPPSKSDVARHIVSHILETEKIEYNLNDVALLIKSYYPDIRSIIKYLQAGVVDNKFVYNNIKATWCEEIVNLLKKPENKTWYEIRDLVIQSQVDDFQIAFRYMFDHLDEFSKGNDAQISVILDEYSWRANVVPDKEINFSAAISKILETIRK